MNFKVKNLEDLENKEKMEDLFASFSFHLSSPLWFIIEVYKGIGLDSSLWKNIDFKKRNNVPKSEFGYKIVRDNIIPNITQGIEEINKNPEKDVCRWHGKIVIIMLGEILKIARTCVKYNRSLEITI